MPTLDLTNRKPVEERNKLPTPSNAGLNELFSGIDKIVIKDGGVYMDKAMCDNILLTLLQPDKIQTFNKLLAIDESNTGFYCMCAGTYAIELHADAQIKATIGFHHGVSVRYDKWNGDAALSNSDGLLTFLAEEGFAKPLEDRIEEKKKMEAGRIAERNWLDTAPQSFKKYWVQINIQDSSFFSSLIDDLNEEFPERHQQIIALLQTFGRTDNFWTFYPAYEELPNDILKTFEVKEIIAAYVNSDRNYKTRKGLGRFLCSFEFKKKRKELLHFITDEVISDLEKCFDSLGEKRGMNEIFSLRIEKNKC